MIHNHGTEEGRGLSCNELALPCGHIIGVCLIGERDMPAYTGHGHHIPGTSPGPDMLLDAVNCGGVENCPRCKSEVESSIAYMIGEKVDYQAKAKDLVRGYVDRLHKQNHPHEDPLTYEVYVIWFAKTLQNWKAILGTTMPDNRLFELTYDGDKKTTYFDCYYKSDNFPIPDEQ